MAPEFIVRFEWVKKQIQQVCLTQLIRLLLNKASHFDDKLSTKTLLEKSHPIITVRKVCFVFGTLSSQHPCAFPFPPTPQKVTYSVDA
jgi:hypothetical protein